MTVFRVCPKAYLRDTLNKNETGYNSLGCMERTIAK